MKNYQKILGIVFMFFQHFLQDDVCKFDSIFFTIIENTNSMRDADYEILKQKNYLTFNVQRFSLQVEDTTYQIDKYAKVPCRQAIVFLGNPSFSNTNTLIDFTSKFVVRIIIKETYDGKYDLPIVEDTDIIFEKDFTIHDLDREISGDQIDNQDQDELNPLQVQLEGTDKIQQQDALKTVFLKNLKISVKGFDYKFRENDCPSNLNSHCFAYTEIYQDLFSNDGLNRINILVWKKTIWVIQ